MKIYRNEKGGLHRIDGPAFEHIDGGKEWWIDGKRHRVDGPAVESSNGYKAWYIDSKRHRVDGPAVEYINRYKEWYIDGKKLTEKDFDNHLKIAEYRFNKVLCEEIL